MITPQNYHAEFEMFVKNRPHDPNNFGFVLKPDMPEWDQWLRYFASKGLDAQLSFMRSRWANGYAVPCRRPEDFDQPVSQARAASRPDSMSQRATPSAPRNETTFRHSNGKGQAA